MANQFFFLKKQLIKFSCTYWLLSFWKILKNSFSYEQNFLGTNHYYYFHLPIGPFHCAKFKKNSYSRSRVMRMHNFWAQNGPFPQMIIFSENLLTSLVSIIHAYLHAKNQSQILIYLLMKYWRLKNTEISLAKSVFDYNLRTRFFPSMQFSQNVSEP